MPTQQLPAELGGHFACTGVIDVRASGGDQRGIEHLQSVGYTLYDLPPNVGERLLDATVSLGKFICPQSSHASYPTLNTNDIITAIVTTDTREVVMIYNHTLKLASYQKTNFYRQAFQFQEFLKSNILMLVLSLCMFFFAPIIWLFLLSRYGDTAVRKAKDEQCLKVSEWIVKNINIRPQQPQAAAMYQSI